MPTEAFSQVQDLLNRLQIAVIRGSEYEIRALRMMILNIVKTLSE